MNYQVQKLNTTARLKAPLQTTQGAPMFSSPWLALYLHLKASLNQNSAS